MSTWVACGNDNSASHTQMALGQSGETAPTAGNGTPTDGASGQGQPPNTAGMGDTNTAGQGVSTGGSGDNQGTGGATTPNGGTGGATTPSGGTGGATTPNGGTGGATMVAGTGGASGTAGTAGASGSAGTAGASGSAGTAGSSGMAAVGGTGGVGGRKSGPGNPPIGTRSKPPKRNESSSPPAIVGTAAGSGCGPSVTIRFKAVVGNEDFSCEKSYAGQGSTNTTVKPKDFRLFVQDLALIRNDGKRVPVKLDVRPPWQAKTVALLDFENHKQECSEGNPESNMEITGTVPAGTYTGLSFANGVPEDLNHTDPVLLPDPLQRYRDLFLDTQRGFRFITADLEADPGDGGGVLHMSSDDCSGNPLRCNRPNRNEVVLDNFNVCADTVLADIGEIFAYSNLAQQTQCVPEGDFCDAIFNAVGVEYATGKPQDGQTTFRKQ